MHKAILQRALPPCQTVICGNLKLSNFCHFQMTLRKKVGHQLDLKSSTSGKVYIKAIYCHPAYLTYMQSTS